MCGVVGNKRFSGDWSEKKKLGKVLRIVGKALRECVFRFLGEALGDGVHCRGPSLPGMNFVTCFLPAPLRLLVAAPVFRRQHD